jgi:RNA polymerase sigma factor (sigma-70 family)
LSIHQNKNDNDNDNELLDKALSIFMRESKTSLLNFLSKLISNGEAEEIAQEAYLKLYLLVKDKPNNHNYVDLLQSLRPMLTVIAKNLALSALRHKKVEGKYAESQLILHSQFAASGFRNKHNAEYQVIADDENLQLIAAINRLPPICRQVFIQRKLHAKSHQKIADMLNISTKTVENHLTKGLVLCRKYMLEQSSSYQGKHAMPPKRMSKAAH